MTKEQKAKYLEHPFACPYCGSEKIDPDQADINEDEITQEVTCPQCVRTWKDIYKLIDVEDYDD